MADPSSTAVLGFAATWFTPTSLFLLLNLMIATIFITSRFTNSAKHHHDSAPIARAPSSLIDRVKSINFSLYKFDHHPLQTESYYHQQYSESDHSQVDPPPLARAPSVLERFKSMNFWHHHQEPEQQTVSEYSTPVDPPPSLLQRLKSINVSSYWNDNTDPDPLQQWHKPVTRTHFEPPPLARAPSFLARVKSINFSLYGPENSYPEETDPVNAAADHQVKRINSDSKPSRKKLATKMKKSASDKSAFGHFGQEEEDGVSALRRPATVREGRKKGVSAEEAGEIDTKADDFINKFRQQLKLQRLDSIMRYKELITRTHENH